MGEGVWRLNRRDRIAAVLIGAVDAFLVDSRPSAPASSSV
jgi:hypothetical protein